MDADLSQGRIVTGEQAPFQEHVELLRLFLTHREDIVERIEAVLNVQRKPSPYLQGRSFLSREFEDCFFARPAVTAAKLASEDSWKKYIGPGDSNLVRFNTYITT